MYVPMITFFKQTKNLIWDSNQCIYNLCRLLCFAGRFKVLGSRDPTDTNLRFIAAVYICYFYISEKCLVRPFVGLCKPNPFIGRVEVLS